MKNRFKDKGTEIEEDMKKIEKSTEDLQSIFNEFATVFNSFVQREMRLETLHKQAVSKARELDKRIENNIIAQTQQRGNLIAMVDDLTR